MDQQMPASTTTPSPAANRLFVALAILSVFGTVGLCLTALFGFEEPNSTLLLVSSLLVLAAPVAMLVHLVLTRELTRQERRIWIRELTGPRAPWAFSDYLISDDRSAAARRLAEEALARRNRQ
jgi:hypothetical protein